MTTYKVTWDETVTYTAEIEAKSLEEARQKFADADWDYPETSVWTEIVEGSEVFTTEED